jgi:hypothetical protein
LATAVASTGEVGDVGRGAAGNFSQNSGSGGREYEFKTGISGHFFLLGPGVGADGKKIETEGFNHFSVACQSGLMPSRIRPSPERNTA